MSLSTSDHVARRRRAWRVGALRLVVGALLALAPASARAQGVGTDIILGVITGEGGVPLADVTVEAFSIETEITRRGITDARGRFTILFPDGSGQYRMTARIIGMIPRTEILVRRADDDRMVWNVRLAPGSIPLEPILVRAGRTPVRAPDGPTPGSAERAFNPDQLARLPLDVTDITLLASLTPGVVGLDGTDSSAAAFSVAGLGPDANALTLDGLLFGAGTIPQDAIRQTRVITSTYDVSRGQFSGGLIAATTRGGTNVVQGSSQYQLRDQDLAVNEEDTPFGQGFTQHLISGGIGGPLARDRLFVFGSGQARLRSDPQQTLLTAGGTDFTRLGVHPDSVTRFLSLVGAEGIPPAIIPSADTRTNDNFSGLLRLDYLLSNAHTFTLRGDWRGTSLDPTRLGPLALPQTGGNIASSGGGVMATLSSRFGAAVINEFRTYLQSARSDGDALEALPQGRVQVASDLPDSSRGVTTLVFGGNPGLPTRSRSTSLETTDELSWMPGARRHRFKLGGLFLAERSHNLVAANQLGTFTYSSLAAMEADRPSSFRRTLQNTTREAQSMRWSLYAGDVWMVSQPLQLTYGARLEGSGYSHPPAYNPAVDSTFDRRTDRLPREWHVSPRVGFTLALGAGRPTAGRAFEPASLVLRGGIGEFRSPVPANLVALAQSGTGLAGSAAEIFCIGPGVPPPDWGSYLSDPATIPDQCASGPAAPAATRQRTVTLLAPGFEAPRAWRASLGMQRSLSQLVRLTVDWSWARGVSQSGFHDLNLATAPRFSLANEGGRPVFVAPADIAVATGVPRFAASRTDSAFGSVLEARSDLASRSNQLTVALGGILGRGILLQTSYTWMRTRDQVTGSRGGNTAGDPNVAEWARSNFERRHSFLATITYPFGPSLEVTSIGRLSAGAPYTPTVGGDVNGDGSSFNDRAFIFAPGSITAEAAAMQRLLDAAAPRVRDCLWGQIGRVAGRNTCTGPWQGSLEFQINWRPSMWGLNRRLMVSVVTQNFLRGVDELFHGVSGAKGWGLTTQPDGRLLYVTGFDTLAQRYTYQVNGRFGATNGSATAFRPPFQIGVQMRLTIGPDRTRQALDQLRAGAGAGAFGRGGFGGPGGPGGPGGEGGARPGANPAQLLNRLESLMPNPAEAVLELRDSLRLDSAQIARLQLVRDSLGDRNHARADSIRAVLQREGTNADPARLFGVLRPQLEAARNDIIGVVETVHGILTEEQWAKVPDAVKTPTARPGQGRPGGPGGAARPPRP